MASLKWWQRAIFYQIYPRSFADLNGDGIGDFPGMTAKLDYLQDLGVDAIWLSPHYPSPFLDCGYDVSDYCGVGPEYGTLDDFKEFLELAHHRAIRVILDLVLNHSSDQHPWFVEARSSLDNPKRDWYVWHPGRDGGPPNNWVSIGGGPAWQLDPPTGQYYYHAFLKEQPDLNWRNPAVKQAVWDAVRFWLDLGVDGFRLDAISTIYEDPALPDHDLPATPQGLAYPLGLPPAEYRQLLRYQTHQPGVHELMQELRQLVDEYPGDRVLVGEDDKIAYHGSGDDELHLVYNFPLMQAQRLTPAYIRANQAVRLAELPPGAWPCNTLGNHDRPRAWNRYGDGRHDAELARLHLALLLTLKGTPFLYYGEEIGMTNLPLAGLDQLRDIRFIDYYNTLVEQLGRPPEEALKEVLARTRDRCRGPMQWTGGPNAGFSPPGLATWLPVNPDYAGGVNVEAQSGDPTSLLNFYRRMLRLRRSTPALIAGDYRALDPDSQEYLTFLRRDQASGQNCLVALNFSERAQIPRLEGVTGPFRLLFSSNRAASQPQSLEPGQLILQPFEVALLELPAIRNISHTPHCGV